MRDAFYHMLPFISLQCLIPCFSVTDLMAALSSVVLPPSAFMMFSSISRRHWLIVREPLGGINNKEPGGCNKDEQIYYGRTFHCLEFASAAPQKPELQYIC